MCKFTISHDTRGNSRTKHCKGKKQQHQLQVRDEEEENSRRNYLRQRVSLAGCIVMYVCVQSSTPTLVIVLHSRTSRNGNE